MGRNFQSKKRIKSLLLAFLMVLTMLPSTPLTAVAAETYEEAATTLAGFAYEISGSSVILTKYTGSDTAVTVADSYTVDGTTYATVLDTSTVFTGNTAITSVTVGSGVRFKDNTMAFLFYGCHALATVDMTGVDTSNVTSLESVFDECKVLTDITGYESWDTSSVTSMFHTFDQTYALTKVDLSKWDLSNVKNTGWCFQLCYATEILLPSSLKTISAGFMNHATKVTGTSFTIPSGVEKIGYAHTFYDFATGSFIEFNVAEGNSKYKVVDGILYSADGTELLAIPRGKTFTDGVYTVPDGVTFMGELSFSRNLNITTVVLPDSFVIKSYGVKDPDYIVYEDTGNINVGTNLTMAVYTFAPVANYTVNDTNSNYTAVDGILYSKDMTQVVAIPTQYGREIVIPEGVTSWNEQAMWNDTEVSNVDNLSNTVNKLLLTIGSISLPATLTEIEDGQLALLNRLATSDSFTITIDEDNPAYQLDENGQLVEKAECTCETKCAEGSVNSECVACSYDYTACDWNAPYLTFTASAEQTMTITVSGSYTLDESLEYSVNEGEWTQLTAGTAITFGGDHGALRLRGKSSGGTASSEMSYAQVTFGNSSVQVACSGDIRTLVDYENHTTADTSKVRFCRLFYECTSLTTAPELPATALVDYCYDRMFYGCTSLTTAPELPATTLAAYCYRRMFYGCTSLTMAPELPATTLETSCYEYMFYSCWSLTTAPVLPATTLAANCYNRMFYSCQNLSSITMLATDISATNCLAYWVTDVASTGIFTKAATMTSLPTGANGIPEGWTVACNHSTTAEGDKAATCTTKAYCSVCESEYGEPLGHSTDAEGDKAATCTTKAYCSRCESEYGGEPAGHSTTADGDRPATCITLAYCSACQSEYGEVDADNHEKDTYTNGFRDCCGAYQEATLNASGIYEIGNAGQLMWFSEYVNSGNFTACGVLTADIDMNGVVWTPIGTETAYTGTFDGQGKTISNLWQNSGVGSGNRDGLFVTVGSGGVVMDVILDSATIWGANLYGANGTGGIAIRNAGTISGCFLTNSSLQQGAYEYLGGIAGVNSGTIENCAVISCAFTRRWGGSSSGSMGGITQTNNGTVKNCYTYGCSFNNGREDKAAVVALGTAPENCYYYTASTVATTYGTAMTTEQFASGEVCYLLNGDQSNIVWKLTIGEDDYPNFTGATVYYGYLSCAEDGQAGYTNDSSASETRYAHSTTAESDRAATCVGKAYCSVCDSEYGEVDLTNHDKTVEYTNGFCPNGCYEPAVLNGDVYEICNAGQLYWFAEKVNGGETSINGKLMEDIEVNEGAMSADSTNARVWTPIGNRSYRYSGTFDGAGKTVSGLYFNDSTTSYVGLFGYTYGGTVRNVGVVNSYLSGKMNVGGVVGINANGTVTNCYNTGAVYGGSEYIGGVVGQNSGSMTECYNTGEVYGENNVGGVVGQNDGPVTKCYNTGSVHSDGTVGGVAGRNNKSVTYCYNAGSVNGGDNSTAGGIVGCHYQGTISNCYNTGSVKGGGVGGVFSYSWQGDVKNCYSIGSLEGSVCAGGVFASIESNVYVGMCYFDSDKYSGSAFAYMENENSIFCVEGRSSAQFASGEVCWTLNGSTSTGVWKQTIGTDGSPNFTGATVYCGYVDCKATEMTYSNTEMEAEMGVHSYDNGFCTACDGYEQPEVDEDGTYLISNGGNLYWFAEFVNGNTLVTGGDTEDETEDDVYSASAWAKLTNDIVVNKNVLAEGGTLNEGTYRDWTPVGNDETQYTGTFDGDGKTVSGLYFNDSSTNYAGLFGCVDGTVQNVGVIDSYFCGNWYVGGVMGRNSDSATVTNCWNTGAVSGNRDVGGVVGDNSGTVINCHNTGEVSGKRIVGGLVGDNSGTVTGCYNTGDVAANGAYYVGGVVGDNSGTVTGCYNTGDLTASGVKYVGGVAGSNSGMVTGCYNTGKTAGTGGDCVGGVVGDNSGTVSNCYNTGTVRGGGDYIGGVVGQNSADAVVTNCYNVNSVTGSQSVNSYFVGGVVGGNGGTVTDCYYLTGCATDSSDTVQNGIGNEALGSTTADVEGFTTAKTIEQFKCGEVAYLLQSAQIEDEDGNIHQVWGQNIDNGKENEGSPVFSDATVYPVYDCWGAIVDYSNTEGSTMHSWGEPVFTWSADYTELRVTLTCTADTTHTLSGSTTEISVSSSEDNQIRYYTATVTLDGKAYTDTAEEEVSVTSVEITWGDMSFTYTDEDGWNNADTAWVQVENTSNTSVNVTYNYETERMDITGSFTDGKTIITEAAILAEESKKVWLQLLGKPAEALDNTTIGSVKLTIEQGGD